MLTTTHACPRCQEPIGEGRFCPSCGAPVLSPCPGCGRDLCPDDRFCPACGHSRSEPPAQDEDLVWTLSVPMFTGRFFLHDLAKFFALTALVMAVVLGFMGVAAGEPDTIARAAPVIGAVLVGLFVMMGIISLAFFHNRYQAIFQIGPNGAGFLAGTRERSLGQFVTIASLLSGNMRAMATSMLAQAAETVTITWQNVHKVRVYPHERVIALYDSWHTALRLHCPEDLFEEVARRARQYAAEGKAWRDSHGVKSGGGAGRILGWLALTGLGTLVGLVYEPETNDVGFMVVLTGMLVFVSGLLPGIMHRGLGVFALLSGLAALAHRVYHALDAYRADEAWLSTAGCAVLVLMALYQIFRHDQKGRETAMFDSDQPV